MGFAPADSEERELRTVELSGRDIRIEEDVDAPFPFVYFLEAEEVCSVFDFVGKSEQDSGIEEFVLSISREDLSRAEADSVQ